MYPTNIYTQHTCVLKSCPSTQSGQYVGLVLGTPSSTHSASPATHTFRHVTPVSTHSDSCDTQEIEAPYASFCVQSSHVTWVMWCHICDKRVNSDSANSRGMTTDVPRHKWWELGLFCGNTVLFCGNVGFLCGDMGLFRGNAGLFCGDVRKLKSQDTNEIYVQVAFMCIVQDFASSTCPQI